ncbi:ABC transporter substrate-binding protein [Sphingomonas canadensis]|uniref:ABC transporter substrate-binding protein n=1 Tax=Sphingomonas canadensis TaxID=1219257 RepID=A0ABW3HAH0_9SPHN|nr:ABC transporter substrate-binding protein [Sphingomonas canadensis]MCW3836152.1 ABC transporter substrate-binding protein [Sphingomonas canadensis]
MIRPALSLALALLLGACGGGRGEEALLAVSAVGGELRTTDPSAGPLDPAGRVLLGAIAQGLVRFDGAGQIEPGLAERWIVTDNGRSYIFRLREAAWPDGRPVTADQVVRTLRRAAAANSRNALAPFLAVIDEIVEMTPQVIEVRLRRPRPDLLKLFAQPEMAILGRGGSGPFRSQPHPDGGVMLTLVPDPAQIDEADAAPPGPRIRLRGERAAVAIARLHQGQIDAVIGGTFADWPVVVAAKVDPATVRIDPAIGLFGLAVTSRTGFFADAANREALSMAIDRGALTRFFRDDWAIAEALLPARLDSAAAPAAPTWLPLPLGARREQARTRVAAWQRAHAEPVIARIAVPAGPGGTIVWRELARGMIAIGVRPVRTGPDDPADLVLIDAVAPYDSARWFLVTACRACPAPLADRITAARDAPTLEERARRIAEADLAILADSAYIPIAQPLRWSIVTEKANGWQGNTRGWHPLNHLRNQTE